MKISILFIIIQFMVLPSSGQLFNRKINAFGEDGLKTGKWITYWDDAKKIPMSKGKYEHGREVGVSKEYLKDGTIRLKFRYCHNGIRVKYYTPDRKLEQKGWAQMEYSEKDVHFYWHGKWKFYDTNRKLNRISWYENGQEIDSSAN